MRIVINDEAPIWVNQLGRVQRDQLSERIKLLCGAHANVRKTQSARPQSTRRAA